MAEKVTLQRVEDALDSVPATDGVTVVTLRDDGSFKKLADRDGVPNYPGHIIILNSREEAADILRRAHEAVSRPSRPDPLASPGDTPPTDEPPRGRLT